MQIEITDTGQLLSEQDFYERHPCIAFPQPLKDEDLAAYGARIHQPAPASQSLADALMAEATRLRWQRETGGITIGSARIATAIDDQNRITSVVANAQLAGLAQVDFKAESGLVTLSLAEITAMAAAIAAHVQGCFSAERAHHEAIAALAAAGDTEALRAYDVKVGWPT